ncbi:hypothetical protein M758_8G106600 [Ceratodon purpureus]|uniref:Secreted protein n=1 Tax=Ceratodon purpureus TaxID=3225 RepID=A0A8T0H260_CERPU|nr:hypothetical protein KC19_8G110000 [Ceratodon purpureus]KAG0608447.1 hypothetical protein M758_8G106600 [Ceratodon purpureus]
MGVSLCAAHRHCWFCCMPCALLADHDTPEPGDDDDDDDDAPPFLRSALYSAFPSPELYVRDAR